jgi:hypothetical protein
MGVPEIEAFLTHLAVVDEVAASTQNQALSALLFLYRVVLQQELDQQIDALRAKRSRYLPTVLTQEEVKTIIQRLSGEYKLLIQNFVGCVIPTGNAPPPRSACYRCVTLRSNTPSEISQIKWDCYSTLGCSGSDRSLFILRLESLHTEDRRPIGYIFYPLPPFTTKHRPHLTENRCIFIGRDREGNLRYKYFSRSIAS